MKIPLSAFVPENLVSRDGCGSPVPRQPAHLHTQAESGACLRDSSQVSRGGVYIFILNRHTPSGQSQVYRVTQLRTDGVYCRESAGAGQVNLKVVPNECRLLQVTMDHLTYASLSHNHYWNEVGILKVPGALVRQAGGYMLETLPDASEETEKTVVNNIAKLLNRAEDPSELLGRGLTPLGIVETLLDGLGGVGALTYKRPAFLCHCSDQRVYQALRLLDKREIQELIKTGDSVEVKCEFCGKEYRLTADDVIKELELTPPEDL